MPAREDVPMALGLCRSCEHLKVYTETTLDGAGGRRIHYCRVLMHEVAGCSQCKSFRSA